MRLSDKVILPTNDLLFRKMLTSPGNEDIARGFISDFLGLAVTQAEPLTTYDIAYYSKALGEGKVFKTELDFRCRAESAYQVLADLQVLKNKVYAKRALYYFCSRYASLYAEGLESEQSAPKEERERGNALMTARYDRLLHPEEIIKLYCLRFKIETCFRAFKQTPAGFAYHFWSASMPQLNRFKKNADAQKELENVQDETARAAIVSAFNAIERFVMCACIAQGLLQMCALHMAGKGNARLFRWLRTNRGSAAPSEDTMADFPRRNIFRAFHFAAHFSILRLIQSVQNADFDSPDTYVA